MFSYANGNVTSVTPPGKPGHGFQYSPVDLEGEYDPPLNGLPLVKTQYRYNRDKQLTTVMRPDGTALTVGYDSAGRASTLAPSSGAGSTVTYGYHATTGQLNSIGNAAVTLGYTYDGALPTQESFSGTVTGSLTRSYDANFRVTGLALNGTSLAFGYDQDSLLTNVGALTFTRNPANGFIAATSLAGVTTALGTSTFGELASFGARYNGAALYDYTLAYDRLGRIKTKTETVAGVATNFDYGYDLAGRLETVKQNGQLVRQYGYNANGNRISLNGAPVGTYDDQDRLLAYAGKNYTFTAHGDLAQKTDGSQTSQYSYDLFGNLGTVTLPDNTLIEYVVDGRNRRVGCPAAHRVSRAGHAFRRHRGRAGGFARLVV